MRGIRQLVAVLDAQPNMEHAEAAVRHFVPGELAQVIAWQAAKPEKVKRKFYGGLAAAELAHRKDVIEQAAAAAKAMEEGGGA